MVIFGILSASFQGVGSLLVRLHQLGFGASALWLWGFAAEARKHWEHGVNAPKLEVYRVWGTWYRVYCELEASTPAFEVHMV